MVLRNKLVLLVFILFLLGCSTTKESVLTGLQNEDAPVPVKEVLEKNSPALGNLCSGEEECNAFCKNNRGRCEAYCWGKEIELCRIIFPDDGTGESRVESIQEGSDCQGTKTTFDYSPVNLDKTKVLKPLGLMTGDHVTPIDHHYFQNFDNHEYDIEVYSPGNGYITYISHKGEEKGKDYRMVIEHTCTISSLYIYISNLPEKILEAAPEMQGRANVRIPVKAGELLGYYKDNLDYSIADKEITLEGFVVPGHYEGEPLKIHTANTYDYFNEPVKSQLVAKSLRTVEPISGKIDYDIDGKLVGNWFLEGTGWYKGNNPEKYWIGHLSIVYDAYDPSRIVLSIVGYEEKDSEQFTVKGNSPNPADISVEDGLVKYELVNYEHITPSGEVWDRGSLVKDLKTKESGPIRGVVLVQMVENRKIKFEVFPGKTASQVSGFTKNAKMYER